MTATAYQNDLALDGHVVTAHAIVRLPAAGFSDLRPCVFRT